MSTNIIVQGKEIGILEVNSEKYISLTDMTKEFGDDPNILIANWLRKKDSIEYLGTWEKLHNQGFKPLEFEGFKNESGTNRFSLSPQKWVESTNALGIISKSGRYGGTYAHEDIAVHFGQWLSPEFSLYVIKEFRRLKELEAQRSSKDWKLHRILSKINYRIHTDAIDKHLIPKSIINNKEKWKWFTSEADILNLALFGNTAKQWKDKNPDIEGNMRDYASQEQLLVLANLETLNSQFIKDALPKEKRLQKLNEAAIEQMTSLLKATINKKLQ